MSDVSAEIREIFSAAGATGFLHAHEVGKPDGPTVDVGAQEPVVLASVFKIPLVVAFARAVAAGTLDNTERVTITSRYRIGGLGTAGCADDVEMSWRDAALFMMTMSDNATTDTIWHRLGQAAVDRVLNDLGLTSTRLIGCCEDLFASMAADLGDLSDSGQPVLGRAPDELSWLAADDLPDLANSIWSLTVLDPSRTNASTPRDITKLLDAIWTDRAASAAACEQVRTIMSRQIWPHRLTSGFESDVQIAAKTGTLPSVRNEAGVVTYPDGTQYAVAVFTRAHTLVERQPAVDASIGRAARTAIDYLRGANT